MNTTHDSYTFKHINDVQYNDPDTTPECWFTFMVERSVPDYNPFSFEQILPIKWVNKKVTKIHLKTRNFGNGRRINRRRKIK